MIDILYVSQFYPPENIAGAFRAYDHARIWAEQGNEVTVFTGWPNYPMGKIFDGYDPKLLEEYNDGDIRILRSKLKASPNTNFLKRVVNSGSFLFFGAINAFFNKSKIKDSHDVVLVSSGPIFTAYLGLLFSNLYKTPLVAEFRDITYEQMVATGCSPYSWKVKLMRFLELQVAKKAQKVIVLTNGFKKILESDGIDPSKIHVVPNGSEVKSLENLNDSTELNFGYFGTMGISQDVPSTLNLVKKVSDTVAIPTNYTLIGEGASRSEVEKAINDYSINATLMHGIPQEELEDYYAKCDFTIVSLKRSPSFKGTVPSKIFQSFARGVPVIFIGPEGEAERIITENDAGIALTGSDEENEKAITAFFKDENWPEREKQMRDNAKRCILGKYSRRTLALNMLDIFKEAMSSSKH